ncbi:hypothetical protein HRJ46_19855 [Vibrio coralliilyticus]|nr:hypothetical protein [Vibrio coralliilyticus]NRG05552.1 hypothetical protein [Vibrio coralliilyticus]
MLKKITILAALTLISSNVFAGNSSFAGAIKAVVCHTDSLSPVCHVEVNGTPSNRGCSDSTWHYTFNGTTPEGRNFLSILLAAQMSGKTAVLEGTGTCNLAKGSADLRHVFISTPN